MKPQLVVLAGPNGAGKSTFYESFLASSRLPFLNADVLAARTGIASQEAARILDEERDRMIDDGRGFITETVFSDPAGAKLAMLRKAVLAGFDVTLIYVGIASPGLSGLRVEQRVAHGGHDVPREKLAGRFERSLANLGAAIAFVSTVKLYDNSSVDEPYRLLAVFEAGVCASRTSGRMPTWAATVVPVTPAGAPSRRRPKR